LIGNYVVGIPTSGINGTDPSFAIDDSQAQELINLRIVGNALESIRPSTNFNSSIEFNSAVNPTTNDIVVFRNNERTSIEFLFAHAGRVYSVSSAPASSVQDIGYSGDETARIRLVVFRNQVFIFNGTNDNYKYDGTNLWKMGIDAPTQTIEITDENSDQTRSYYYTYYNSIGETESNPDNGAISSKCDEAGTHVKVYASSDSQVDKIRIYRTGVGISTPRLCQEVPNATDTIFDTSTDGDVAGAKALEIDHDRPLTFLDGVVHNNRLFAWGGLNSDGTVNRDTLWISNEYEPQYFPVVPFIEQTSSSSGGPIKLNPGDGGTILKFVPWGGAGIVFKDTAVYRIQETEVGFYGYQVMSIPPVLESKSIQVSNIGIIYLTDNGLALFDANENLSYIGYPIKYYTDLIDTYETLASAFYMGQYIISFENAISNTRQTFIYNTATKWSGPHTIVDGTSYFVDINGNLYSGRSDKAGIATVNLNIVGYNPRIRSHAKIPIKFLDKAREFNFDYYSRVRSAKLSGQLLGPYAETFTLKVCDENDVVLDETDFTFPNSGTTNIGVGNEANSPRLAFALEGNIKTPVRIGGISLIVEKGATVQE